MKLSIFTIVLDGMPFIQWHYPIFQQLKRDWRWIIVHGAAMNGGSTKWCQPQEPRLSQDGTGDYLYAIAEDERITVIEDMAWPSKDAMVNMALKCIDEPCVLMQIDSDEIWEPWQLERIVERFDEIDDLGAMQFRCRYFVGENLITCGRHCYGDMDYEWWRAWRFVPGQKFISHEPPKLDGHPEHQTLKDESEDLGLTFDHYAYATEAQVRYKEKFYGYTGLLDGWRRLQQIEGYRPVYLRDYFPHVKDHTQVVRLHERWVFDRHTGKWNINPNVPCPT